MEKINEIKDLWEKNYVSNKKEHKKYTDYLDKWGAVLYAVTSEGETQRFYIDEKEYLENIEHLSDDKRVEMMPCGCRVIGRDVLTGLPMCPIHDTVGAKLVDEKRLLKNRKAKCSWCNNRKDSSFSLPFFNYQPEKDEDSFYCGCGGWD